MKKLLIKICTNKKCPKCFESKPIIEFTKDISQKDGLSVYCKEHKREVARKYHEKFPWRRTLEKIKQRCENPKDKNYKYYGGRGIENHLIEEDVKFLYIRDKANLMKIPSIDRKDNDGNYTLKNCRFIEKNLNSQKDKFKTILQYSLDGEFIKEWNSILSAEEKLEIWKQNICKVLKGKRITAGGFIWKYKELK